MSIPKISVIMPVYNAETYLEDAIGSILNQSFKDFEFIIIDDASTDKSASIVKLYTDKRIVFIEKPINKGLIDSLNMAIPISKGKYIARMDADDISFENRFEKQFTYLEQHPDILLLGAWYNIIGSDFVSKTLPVSYGEVILFSLTHSPVAHPTAFIRRTVFDQYKLLYDENFKHAEDYDLWTKIIDIGKVENLPETLLYYRQHECQVSQIHQIKQLEVANKIRARQLSKIINFDAKSYDVDFVVKILSKQKIGFNQINHKKVKKITSDFFYAINSKNLIEVKFLICFVKGVWMHYLCRRQTNNIRDIIVLFHKKRMPIYQIGFFFNVKFILKSIFK